MGNMAICGGVKGASASKIENFLEDYDEYCQGEVDNKENKNSNINNYENKLLEHISNFILKPL